MTWTRKGGLAIASNRMQSNPGVRRMDIAGKPARSLGNGAGLQQREEEGSGILVNPTMTAVRTIVVARVKTATSVAAPVACSMKELAVFLNDLSAWCSLVCLFTCAVC